MTSQNIGICSGKQPSMLRANTKEIVNLDFEKRFLEWKEKAPILSNDMCSITRKENAPQSYGFLA